MQLIERRCIMQEAFIAQGDEKAKEYSERRKQWSLSFPGTPLRGPMKNMINVSQDTQCSERYSNLLPTR
jgi:hypothetical protein